MMNNIIKKLVDLNFTVENYPEFVFFEEDTIDIDTIVKLKQIGINFTKDFFIEKFNLKPEQFDTEQFKTTAENKNFSEEVSDFFEEGEYKEVIEEERLVDDYIKKTLDDFKNSFSSFLNDVFNAVERAESYDEAVENLLKTLGKDRKNYEIIGKLLIGVDLLTQNQLQKTYNFSEKYIDDQLDFLKMKVPLSKDDYKELYDKYKNYGFTIAAYQEEDIIANVLNKLIETRENGFDYKYFKQSLAKEGLKVDDSVYFQNVRNAQMAAKYNMLKRNIDDYPYWQYIAIMDGHTRPSHSALHGKVYRADDPVWNSIYPPNGFGCRCTVRPLNHDMLIERKLSIEKSSPDFTPDKGFNNNVGKDLNWIREKQMEAVNLLGDKKIVEQKIFLKKIITKDGLKNNELLLDVPEFESKNFKNKEDTGKYIDDFCRKNGFENKEIDLIDYRGKIIKMNFRELIRHIVEDAVNEKDSLDRIKRLKYIKFVPDILKNPDSVIANIYARKTETFKTKVSKRYVKKINNGRKDEFVVLAINYDREKPDYRGATLYTSKDLKGWIIK